MAICPKKELKEKLKKFDENLNLKEDTLIIQICETVYNIYYKKKNAKKENISIQLSSALRFRMELDLLELEQVILQVDQAVLQYPFDVLTKPYCLVRYMDLSDDFLILDTYVGVKELTKPRCVPYEKPLY